jgi:hypothetical protein
MDLKTTVMLDAALSDALQLRWAKPMPFQLGLKFDWVQDARFQAKIEYCHDCCFLEVSTGLTNTIENLWSRVNKDNLSRVEGLTKETLIWVILHELSHLDLGHFKLATCFSLAQRASLNAQLIDALQGDMPAVAPLCVEMQADHEATDILLSAYSTDGWHDLREKVLAISGMMMLIEIEDAKNNAEGHTHPRAATRIFQLLGHLAEMPLVQAHIEKDASFIPTEDELQAFAHEVSIPCFFDAIQLAQAAGAASIADDLGSPEDFFKDVEIAKLGDPSRHAHLKTQGAQEWAKLWPCNEALKTILGGHFTN